MKNRINLLLSSLIYIGLSIAALPAIAQLNPLGASYYQNPYLLNPAMAGREQVVILNAGLSQMFSKFPGGPVTQAVSLDYGMTSKAGLGVMLYHESAGVLQQVRATGTYAYHLPLNDADQKLHFGVSLSVMNDKLDHSAISGDMDDPDLMAVDRRETYIDGDFGVAFTTNSLTIEAALPNLKRLFKQDMQGVSGTASFFSGLSYRLRTSFGALQPKVIYRGMKGFDNLLVAGLKTEFKSGLGNVVHFTGLYHNSKSATIGLGMDFKNTFSFNGLYTTSTAPMQGYTNGNFEVGIAYKIGNR
jgi:type IX secretion system PorP/SprF family membrane protein